MTTFAGFEDMGDDFDNEPVTVDRPATLEDASKMTSVKPKGTMIEEKCPKCAGSGHYRAPSSLGHNQCLKCKGKGILYFAKPAAERKLAREKAAVRKEVKADKVLADFEAKNPEIAAWWNGEGKDFSFASSLREAVRKYGDLTPRQLGAALKCIEAVAAKKVAAEAREVHAQTLGPVDVGAILKALNKAKSNGLKNPKIRLLAGETNIVIYFASAHGNNAGSLYVKNNVEDLYLGKITDGKFYRGRGVCDDLETDIIKACSDPSTAAVAYGQRTGECSCCGRELTNAQSIARSIGPICFEKFFG